LIYPSGDMFKLVKQVERLFEDRELREKLGRGAVDTILQQWNAENAADRLLKISEKLVSDQTLEFYEEGPCSKAEVIKQRKMYKVLRGK